MTATPNFCTVCGQKLEPGWNACPACGARFGERAAPPSEPKEFDRATRWLLPVGRSGHAIAAGYLGLFTLVLWFLAPVAIVFGILGIRQIRRDPTKHGMGRAIFGIVAGGLVTLAFVAFLVATAASA